MTKIEESIIFAAWTLIFWIITASISKVFHIATQEGQLLGGWQKRLRSWDMRGDASGRLFSKIGGYCEVCYSHAWAVIGFLVYTGFVGFLVGLWPPSWGGFLIDIIFNVVWAVCFVHTATIINLYFICKLFSNGNNNEN